MTRTDALVHPRVHGLLGFLLSPLTVALVVSLHAPGQVLQSSTLAVLCAFLLGLKSSSLGTMSRARYVEAVTRSTVAGASSTLMAIAVLTATCWTPCALAAGVSGVILAIAAFR